MRVNTLVSTARMDDRKVMLVIPSNHVLVLCSAHVRWKSYREMTAGNDRPILV